MKNLLQIINFYEKNRLAAKKRHEFDVVQYYSDILKKLYKKLSFTKTIIPNCK